MRELELVRFANTPMGAFGRLPIPDGPILYTVEDPWKDNRVGESCIPAGRYLCRARPFYGGGYDAIEITGVPGRTHILIHIANTHRDIKGCIGVGGSLGFVKGQWAVTASTGAFNNALMKWFAGEEFDLVIRWEGNPETENSGGEGAAGEPPEIVEPLSCERSGRRAA